MGISHTISSTAPPKFCVGENGACDRRLTLQGPDTLKPQRPSGSAARKKPRGPTAQGASPGVSGPLSLALPCQFQHLPSVQCPVDIEQAKPRGSPPPTEPLLLCHLNQSPVAISHPPSSDSAQTLGSHKPSCSLHATHIGCAQRSAVPAKGTLALHHSIWPSTVSPRLLCLLGSHSISCGLFTQLSPQETRHLPQIHTLDQTPLRRDVTEPETEDQATNPNAGQAWGPSHTTVSCIGAARRALMRDSGAPCSLCHS